MTDDRRPSEIYRAGGGVFPNDRVAALMAEADRGHERRKGQETYRVPADVPADVMRIRDDEGNLWRRAEGTDDFAPEGPGRRKALVEIFDVSLTVTSVSDEEQP